MSMMRIPLGAWGLTVRDAAIANGCTPMEWADEDGDWVWVCGCKDECHFGDQQSSIITPESAARRRDGKKPVIPIPEGCTCLRQDAR